MRSTRTATAAAAVLLLSLSACGATEDTPDVSTDEAPAATADVEFEEGTTMAALSEEGSITVGTKYDQPLFGLQGLEGVPEGFDIEIAKIIASELGIGEDGIEFVETPSRVREEVLESGDVDVVVATYTINDERRERVTFAGPYYDVGQDLMVRVDNDDITGPEDLRAADATVCSATGTSPAEKILEYVDESKVVLFDVYSKCADALRTGQVDAVTTDNVILLGLISQNDGEDFKLVDNVFTDEPWGIGVPKGDIAFCEFINDTLTKAYEDGRYTEAWDATAGQVSEDTPELPELGTCS